MPLLLFFATLITLTLPDLVLACGPTSHCVIDDRHYRVRMPENYQEGTKVGAIVFAHGVGGSTNGILKSASMKKIANDLGVALIATKSAAKDWSIPHAPSPGVKEGVNELAYFDKVIADATTRFPIDPDRLMMTGFSAGGMMVWNLACYRSDLFAAFAPMAGTFWRPEPTTCDRPVANVVHVHGDSDRTVPLTGRKVHDAHQGDVATVLAMYREFGRFRATGGSSIGPLRCENFANQNGKIFNYCFYSGGHAFKAAYIKHAWDIFVAAGKL